MRTKPYTSIGISRVPCFRCGGRAVYQWQICADNRVYRTFCAKCDIALNKLVLRWMGFKDWQKKIDAYKASAAR